MNRASLFKSITWKLGVTFFAILLLLSGVYLFIAVWTAEMYYQETMQKLGADIAPNVVKEHTFFANGQPDIDSLEDLFHDIMVINPSLEVYLLDADGQILTYYAPNKKIELTSVDLEPVRFFIDNNGDKFVMGNDPKHPGAHKTFSAAEINEDGALRGYLYIVMEGEEFVNATHFVFGSYMLRLAVRSTSITLIASTIISFLAVGFITKQLRKIVTIIRRFKEGDYNARINFKTSGEIKVFADSFNEMADTIITNMQEIKTMDGLRRDLVANVSHDLRTPLASIRGYAETILLKQDNLSETEMKKHLETILSSAERLNNLVAELFELSKLEARETKPEPEPFQIIELVQDVYQKNRVLAESGGISFTVDSPSSLALVYADIGMIERVLQNLLDNAFKFTSENGAVVIKLDNSGGNVRVTVADTGRGIPEDELPFIFNRYRRTDKDKKSIDGLGLGLAIVKKILEVHNIEITVESKLNKGTGFSFLIPFYKREKVYA